MINLPYNEILRLIKEKSDLSEEEINYKVNDKLNQLSGLISKEGAAHIIANELGVQLIPKEGEQLKIKNILSGMRNVETIGRLQQIYEIREFNSAKGPGKVASILLGDESGVIRVVLWNDQIELLDKIKEGDTLKISGATSRDNNGRKELHLNDNSKVQINPKGQAVSEVKQRELAKRKKISDLTTEDENIEILGTIVQLYDIKFFEVCPHCGKRTRAQEGEYNCPQHGKVDPAFSYVFNIFIDDGSSSIRVVCFKNQFENLIKKNVHEILEFRESPELFEPIKQELLGHIVKIRGRVSNNEMFGRLEMVSNLIIVDPNPEEELKRLESEIGTKKAEVKKESVKKDFGKILPQPPKILDSKKNMETKISKPETSKNKSSTKTKEVSNISDDFFEDETSKTDEDSFDEDESDKKVLESFDEEVESSPKTTDFSEELSDEPIDSKDESSDNDDNMRIDEEFFDEDPESDK